MVLAGTHHIPIGSAEAPRIDLNRTRNRLFHRNRKSRAALDAARPAKSDCLANGLQLSGNPFLERLLIRRVSLPIPSRRCRIEPLLELQNSSAISAVELCWRAEVDHMSSWFDVFVD